MRFLEQHPDLALVLRVLLALTLIAFSGLSWGSPWAVFPGVALILFEIHASQKIWRSGLLAYLMALPIWLVAYGSAWPFLPLQVTVAVLALGLPYLVAGMAYAAMGGSRSRFGTWLFLVVWCLAENIAGSHTIFGLWANPVTLGYSQAESPLRQLAFWGGLPLVGVGVMACAVALELAWRLRRFIPMVFCLVLVFVFSVVPNGLRSQPTEPSLGFALVQGNHQTKAGSVAQTEVEAVTTARTYAKLSAGPTLFDVLVWPEMSYPAYLQDEQVPEALHAALRPFDAVLFGGLRTSTWTHDSFNTAFFSRFGKIKAIYEKQFPVPLFEDHFTRGDRLAVLTIKEVSIGVGICWDSLVSGLARQYALGSRGVLVSLADTSFAVNTETARYHMRASSMRAAETGRYVVHASQAGPSAIFDDSGALLQSTSSDTAQVLVERVPARSFVTPYTRFGNWVLGVLMVVAASAMLDFFARAKPSGFL